LDTVSEFSAFDLDCEASRSTPRQHSRVAQNIVLRCLAVSQGLWCEATLYRALGSIFRSCRKR
jgi:hypothetical protein